MNKKICWTVSATGSYYYLKTKSLYRDRADRDIKIDRRDNLYAVMHRLAVQYGNRDEAIAVLFEIG